VYDLKEKKGYCKLKEETLDRSLRSNGLGSDLDLTQGRLQNDEVKPLRPF